MMNYIVGEKRRPRMGAWIEIHNYDKKGFIGQRRPRMGAWIEISMASSMVMSSPRVAPAWGRGLKSC